MPADFFHLSRLASTPTVERSRVSTFLALRHLPVSLHAEGSLHIKTCVKHRLIKKLILPSFKLTKSSLKRYQTQYTSDYLLQNYLISSLLILFVFTFVSQHVMTTFRFILRIESYICRVADQVPCGK